jgi:hypothetical protein
MAYPPALHELCNIINGSQWGMLPAMPLLYLQGKSVGEQQWNPVPPSLPAPGTSRCGASSGGGPPTGRPAQQDEVTNTHPLPELRN